MNRPRHGVPGRRAGGFTLIELMISLALGLLVLGAAFVVFRSNQNSFRATEGINRIQENARAAFELISQDIRAAGGSVCSWDTHYAGDADSQALLNGWLSGSNTELTIISGSSNGYRLQDAGSSFVDFDPDSLADATTVFSAGDRVLLCNPTGNYVVTVTGVGAGRLNFSGLPAGVDLKGIAGITSVAAARYSSARWFVARNPRGGSSLFVSRSGGNSEEVAEGVAGITFFYRQKDQASYVNAPAGDVVAIRTQLQLTAQDVDGRALSRTVSNVVSIRRAAP
ncbi:PilW family protein [Stenotrophomonas mori]|uniref:Prepilin-type N-terminal cleavage/methylation domain-containing protein n=1 Tax=Stenotrophomonas mori TaxID=2871096 RepID=A0ABT0SFU1_9GAMM|nr:prepilin-type N-terminal cleavage/methylation domain-containing protein [Stenotrophomonas mori]